MNMEEKCSAEFLTITLLIGASLILPVSGQPLSPLIGQQFGGIPVSMPSFVYYRDSQSPERILFSPINTPYTQFRINRNLRDDIQPPLNPGPLSLSGISSAFVPPIQNGFISPISNGFPLINNNGFVPPPNYNNLIPTINIGLLSKGTNGFASLGNDDFASPYGNVFRLPNGRVNSLSQQVSSLRYAGRFAKNANLLEEVDKDIVSDLRPTFQQRQRNAANAGELVYRQQRVGARPFLTMDAEGVQREGEDLSSPEGFLGQPHRRPTFVTKVGTPASGVGQNPLFTGKYVVQASKLDEASDVRGVKHQGGIPAPGRLPVSNDVPYTTFSRYANNFGYSIREDPVFNNLAPSLVSSRGPFIPPPVAYQRGIISR